MFKFLTKQLIYGRIYLWVKDKLGAILFLFISIFLIIYFHNEYLNYIEYKEKFAESYVGLSFVIKNILTLLSFTFFLEYRHQQYPYLIL